MKRTPGVLLLTALGLCWISVASGEGLPEWIKRKLRIKSGSGLSGLTRGETACTPPHPLPRRGQTLRQLECSGKRGKEKVLWRCDSCWSPLPLPGGDIAVLRETGIWRLSGGRPELWVGRPGLAVLLGVLDGTQATVAVSSEAGELLLVDLDAPADKRTLGAADIELRQEEQDALRSAPSAYRPDSVGADGRALVSDSARCGPYEILVAQPGEVRKPFCESWSGDGARGDGLDRFDPVFSGRGVLYLAAPRAKAGKQPGR